MSSMMMPTKPKKKSAKVEPLEMPTELLRLEIGSPPSTSDFGELFERDSERGRPTSRSSRPMSGAFTEETNLISAGNSTGRQSEAREDEEMSSRSSTPSSAGHLMKKVKKNVVVPINEETAFVEGEPDVKPNPIQSWSEGLNETIERRSEVPVKTRMHSVPFSPKLFPKNRVTPLPSKSSTPDIQITPDDAIVASSSRGSTPVATVKDEGVAERSLSEGTIKSVDSQTKLIPFSSNVDTWSKGEQGTVNEIDLPEKEVAEDEFKGEQDVEQLSVEAVLAPPKSSGENEAYIPMDMAKQCIQRVIEDMKKMKANHYSVVEKIQEQYQLIEEESQAQFNDYVLKLRDEYKSKVFTFKQVIESQQSDFNRKQKFYEEAIKSLRDKNRSLLLDKRQQLLKAKDIHIKHEEEKYIILADLSSMCDQKHKDYVDLRQRYDEKKRENEMLTIQIAELNAEVGNLQLSIGNSSEENDTLLANLTEKEKEGEELKRQLEESKAEHSCLQEEKGAVDSLLSEINKLIEDKDKLSEEKDKLIEEKGKLNEEKENDLQDKSKIIEELESQIKEMERQPTTATANADVAVPLVNETGISATVKTTEAIKLDTVEASAAAIAETSDTGTSQITLVASDTAASAVEIEATEAATGVQVDTADASTSERAVDTIEAGTSATIDASTALALSIEASDGTTPVQTDAADTTDLIQPLEITSTHDENVAVNAPSVVTQNYQKKISIQEEIIQKREGTLRDLNEKVDQKDVLIEKLEKEIEDLKGDYKDREEKLLETAREDGSARNALKMELADAREQNNVLHARLETMLNEVADSVNIEDVQSKLQVLEETKNASELKVVENNEKIKEWEEKFAKEHDGNAPDETDRPDEINDLLLEIKSSNEQLQTMSKDITVMNMLLDGTLPDDMKQEGNAEKPDESAIEELQHEHKKEIIQLDEQLDRYRNENSDLENEKNDLKTQNRELESKIKDLETRVDELETANREERVLDGATVASSKQPAEDSSESLNELNNALSEAEARIEELETEHTAEIEVQKKQSHKLEKKLKQQLSAVEQLTEQKRELESQLKVTKESADAELKIKQDSLDEAKKELDELNEKKLENLPVKAKTEIKAIKDKLEASENLKDELNQEILSLSTKNGELTEQIANMEIKVTDLQGKEVELQKLQEVDKKYKELKVKYKKLEAKKTVTKPAPTVSVKQGADPEEVKDLKKKVSDLEKKLHESEAKDNAAVIAAKKEPALDTKALAKLEKSNEVLKGKVESMTAAAKVGAEKIRDLDQKLKDAVAKANDKSAKKQEKAMKDLEKKLETAENRTAKFKDNLENEKAETAKLTAEIEALQAQKKKDKEELAKLGVAAAEGLEAAEKVSELTKSNKQLTEENKVLAENFNSERILRKKYYNMVEDMKGKIRVYCRARPLSRSELDRGNHNIISSPDEYSVIVQTPRGPKDFQYDAVFTPDQSQVDVFEDTNRLIQSAVDGYNVCIFAYGQTGSGKTFTMIGDKEQNHPGIAPRAFKAIYELIEENKSKFTFATSMYMMELYRDNLIDLFGDHKNPAKLDIKKDKKGMVVVTGAVIQEAGSSDELMQLFELGSASRHVASTKMNAESSRSHLVLSIIIESTNITSGAVVKGKLSLVDLAGSERAAKTGATPEQLKEAQSINKSLSALGDVISALSSEQAFIPYRNNKLTMLMQDSLGGNAKTLMFVNISPADYNSDETITSLTYASRVKLITNDASKNSDNKEIAKLKGIIAKLKKGENVDDDEIE